MRAFSPGEPFIDTKAEAFIPDDFDLREMRADLERDGVYPVFSEGHLYPRLGKDDARFVLAIAEEYTKIISVLGVEKVRELLREK